MAAIPTLIASASATDSRNITGKAITYMSQRDRNVSVIGVGRISSLMRPSLLLMSSIISDEPRHDSINPPK